MTRARRSVTDREILDMQLSQSAARRLRGGWPLESVTPTGLFLWLAFALTVLLLAGTYVWEWYRPEQNCDHVADATARIECTQRRDGKSGGEGQDVVHGAQSRRKPGRRA